MTEATRHDLGDESIAGMLRDLVLQIILPFRQEIALARAEVSDATSRTTAVLITLGADACLGIASLVILFEAAASGLATTGLPLWLSQIAIGGGAAIIAAVLLALSGKHGIPAQLVVGPAKRTGFSGADRSL